MINFLLEKEIQCAQMSVDCLRASKLVTLGYVCGIGLFSYLTYLHLRKKMVEGNKHRCVNKTSRDKAGACENGAIGYRRKLPSVEIIFPRDIIFFLASVILTLPGYDKNKTK